MGYFRNILLKNCEELEIWVRNLTYPNFSPTKIKKIEVIDLSHFCTDPLFIGICNAKKAFSETQNKKSEDFIRKHRTDFGFAATILLSKSYRHKKRKRLIFAFP